MVIPTKLNIPETRSRLFPRAHLMQALNDGLHAKVTLAVAGAGYGKSTLLSEWAKQILHPVSWFSLDEQDNAPSVFWSHLIRAMDQVLPSEVKSDMLDTLQQRQCGQAILPIFINSIHHYTEPIILILDDFHVIKNPTILDDISLFLQSIPDHMHLYIASRAKVPISVAKLNIHGQLKEIGQEDFRLQNEEVASFFEQCTNVQMGKEMYDKIFAQTEGWITGLRLVSLSTENFFDNTKNKQDTLVNFTLDAAYFSRYFTEEVLQRQRTEVQQFLMQTAILDNINVPLAVAITGLDNVPYILKELQEKNMFLIALDTEGKWYRYHHLFQEFLQTYWRAADPSGMQKAHIAAGEWLFQHDQPEAAISHFLQAGDYHKVIQLLEYMLKISPVHQKMTWHKWMREIPNHQLFKSLELFLLHLSCLYFASEHEQVEKKYWWAIDYLQLNKDTLDKQTFAYFEAGLNFLVAFRSYFEGSFEDFIHYSEKFLQTYPQGELLLNIGMDEDGDHLAWDISITDDDMSKAENRLIQLLTLWKHTESELFYAHLCIDIAKFYYEKNELSKAKAYSQEGLMIANANKNTILKIHSYFVLAQIGFAKQDTEVMFRYVKKAIEASRQANHSALERQAVFLKKQFQLKMDNSEPMKEWLEVKQITATDELSIVKLEEYIALVRIMEIAGENERALHLTNRLILLLDELDNDKSYMRLHSLVAALYDRKKEAHKGFLSLKKALKVAKEGGYIRTLIDDGPKTREVLEFFVQEVQQHHYILEDHTIFVYAKELLALWKVEGKAAVKVEEVLTLKEQIVLTCIYRGMTNREIAVELNVSASTVKTHVNNLYRKLNVNNRIMALQKAHEMELIQENAE